MVSCLLGSEKGFQLANRQETNFFVPGDAKALSQIKSGKDEVLLLASQNQDDLKVFEQKRSFIALDNDIAWVEISLDDGQGTRKVEVYYGHGYLSQSSRILTLPENTQTYKVFDYQGQDKTAQYLQ